MPTPLFVGITPPVFLCFHICRHSTGAPGARGSLRSFLDRGLKNPGFSKSSSPHDPNRLHTRELDESEECKACYRSERIRMNPTNPVLLPIRFSGWRLKKSANRPTVWVLHGVLELDRATAHRLLLCRDGLGLYFGAVIQSWHGWDFTVSLLRQPWV
jgi:hypothetical protein